MEKDKDKSSLELCQLFHCADHFAQLQTKFINLKFFSLFGLKLSKETGPIAVFCIILPCFPL